MATKKTDAQVSETEVKETSTSENKETSKNKKKPTFKKADVEETTKAEEPQEEIGEEIEEEIETEAPIEEKTEEEEDVKLEEGTSEEMDGEVEDSLEDTEDKEGIPKEKPVIDETAKERAKRNAEVLTKDEMAAMLAIFQGKVVDENTFERRRVAPSTKEERQELYKENERIVKIEGIKAESDADRARSEAEKLEFAATSVPPQVLDGIVESFHKTDNGMWVIDVRLKDSDGTINIQIPLEQFVVMNHNTYENELQIINELTGRIHSEIKFMPFFVNKKIGKAIGSRVAAMSQIGRHYYVNIVEQEGLPKICNDMIVPAIVTCVRRDRVKVDVAGAEVTIHSEELSWTALDSIENEFKVGDVFNVKVSDIRTEKYVTGKYTYEIIQLKASKRLAETNPAKKYISCFREGEFCAGEIKAFTGNGMIFVRVKDKMDCLCRPPKSGVPMRGDKVVVIIKEVDRERNTLYGIIKSM